MKIKSLFVAIAEFLRGQSARPMHVSDRPKVFQMPLLTHNWEWEK